VTLSKSQIDKLGERLRKAETEDDVRLFNELLDRQRNALNDVQRAIVDIDAGLLLGGRLKSLRSTVEKLRRSTTMELSQMQDLGGIRVMVSSREEQDDFVSRLRASFPRLRVKDRRIEPQHGYRAVHAIVTIDKILVEVQIRTTWQHFWAERFERIADLIGRDIRYGLRPRHDSEVARRALEVMQRLSTVIDLFERSSGDEVAAAVMTRDSVVDELIGVWRELFRSGV
jgi:ppGpp synthetase/RelA/SpoT-type nucleotidyltranferase